MDKDKTKRPPKREAFLLIFRRKSGGASRSRTGLTGFAIRGITALLSRRYHKNLERENGFEPSTYTLARYRSTN